MPEAIPPPPFGEEDSISGAPSLASLSRQVSRLAAAENARAASSAVLTRMWAVFGTTITAGAVALGGWVWTVQADVGDLGHATRRNSERLEVHAASGGGHPESVIARIARVEGRAEANAASALRVENHLEAVDAKLDEILERLPRGRR